MYKMYLRFFILLMILLSSANIQAIPIAGGSSGIFINPTGPSGMTVTGVGTNNFTWGVGSPPSSLEYTGNTFAEDTDDVFSFGTLEYFNGAISGGTQADSVNLSVLLSLTSPAGIIESFQYNMGLINTINTNDPNASADIVNLPSTIPNTFFTIGSVDYTLEFMGFGVISGSGFTTIDNFHVLEGFTASAEMLGRITVAPTSVPEPGTLMLICMGAIGFMVKGKQRKSA